MCQRVAIKYISISIALVALVVPLLLLEERPGSKTASEIPRTMAREWDADEILPGIWLGSYSASMDATRLHDHHIGNILSVGMHFRRYHEDGFEYLIVCAEDIPSQNLISVFDQTANFIRDAIGASILVHCMQGRSRSATILAAYLIRERGKTVDEALALLRQARPIVEPNRGFERQLRVYEQIVRDRSNAENIQSDDAHHQFILDEMWLKGLGEPTTLKSEEMVHCFSGEKPKQKFTLWHEFLFHTMRLYHTYLHGTRFDSLFRRVIRVFWKK